MNLQRITLAFALAAVFPPARAAEQPPSAKRDFVVTLPAQKLAFPEPLPPGASPGFKFRGTKGWFWRPAQYLAEIPYLVQFKMNFLMNCYSTMFDYEHHPVWGDRDANRWWEDIPEAKKREMEAVVRACQKNGIEFCFSMNPNLFSRRIVNDDSPEKVDQLWKHYAWMQSLGVRWFNISLDDATEGVNPSTQARVVNEIFRRLRARDPGARMIFCPTYYSGDGTRKGQQPYLEALAREMNPDIYFFWTGDAVVGKVTRKAAENFRRLAGHRIFLWDNYPVNDGHPTLNLGPVIERDANLGEVVDGYMSNPHFEQNEINRIPLATCADYAYNPKAYDPARSIGQAIVHLADTPEQQTVLKDLVEAYPGMLISGSTKTGFNPVREQYRRIVRAPHSRLAAKAYLDFLRRLSARLKEAFPGRYEATKRTVDADIAFLEQAFADQYGG